MWLTILVQNSQTLQLWFCLSWIADHCRNQVAERPRRACRLHTHGTPNPKGRIWVEDQPCKLSDITAVSLAARSLACRRLIVLPACPLPPCFSSFQAFVDVLWKVCNLVGSFFHHVIGNNIHCQSKALKELRCTHLLKILHAFTFWHLIVLAYQLIVCFSCFQASAHFTKSKIKSFQLGWVFLLCMSLTIIFRKLSMTSSQKT